MIKKALAFLWEKDTGVCRKNGKSFGDLIRHFIVGSDENCMMASYVGSCQVVGYAKRKKNEKKKAECCALVTLYRVGNAAGDTGPTMFLLKGLRKIEGYMDDFLLSHSATPGSSIFMNENAYMTDETWAEMTPQIIDGIRKMPWHALEIFEGHGSNLGNLQSKQKQAKTKIQSYNEEGDASQLNQAYDQDVAKNDNKNSRESNSWVCAIHQFKNKIVGLACIRQTTKEMRINSLQSAPSLSCTIPGIL